MRIVVLRATAWAQVQYCGIWIQCRGTIAGLFPEWWWDSKDKRHKPKSRPFVLGLKIWAWDHNRGRHTVLGLKTKWGTLTLKREAGALQLRKPVEQKETIIRLRSIERRSLG